MGIEKKQGQQWAVSILHMPVGHWNAVSLQGNIC